MLLHPGSRPPSRRTTPYCRIASAGAHGCARGDDIGHPWVWQGAELPARLAEPDGVTQCGQNELAGAAATTLWQHSFVQARSNRRSEYWGSMVGVVRSWWNGLRPGDRRLAGLCLGIIAATLPCYLAAGLVLTMGYTARLAEQDASSHISEPTTVARQADAAPSARAEPSPTAAFTGTPNPPVAGRPTASPLPTNGPPAVAAPGTSERPTSSPAEPTASLDVAAASPTPRSSAAAPASLQCQSLPGSVSPAQYFDVLESRARPQRSRDLVVEGVIHNNCNRPLRAVVHAEARDARGERLAVRQVAVGELAPDARHRFEVSLGSLRAVPAVVIVGADREP